MKVANLTVLIPVLGSVPGGCTCVGLTLTMSGRLSWYSLRGQCDWATQFVVSFGDPGSRSLIPKWLSPAKFISALCTIDPAAAHIPFSW